MEVYRWAWFRKFCLGLRVTSALLNRLEFPEEFKAEVHKKVEEMEGDDGDGREYEHPEVFKQEEDEQLLHWIHNRPQDWTLPWGNTEIIYGWGKQETSLIQSHYLLNTFLSSF